MNSFAKDYYRLSDDHKNKYESIINEKIDSFKSVCKVLASVVETTVREFFKPSIDYTETFAKIEQFLSDFDEYTPETKKNNFRANATGISVSEITSSRV